MKKVFEKFQKCGSFVDANNQISKKRKTDENIIKPLAIKNMIVFSITVSLSG
jgi:hypothetical protein